MVFLLIGGLLLVLHTEQTQFPSKYPCTFIPTICYFILIPIDILLKLRNTDKLERIFWEVNNPQHYNYGKFLTTAEVNELITPEPASINKYLNYTSPSVFNYLLAYFTGFFPLYHTIQ
jgi:subtilase family serine protease